MCFGCFKNIIETVLLSTQAEGGVWSGSPLFAGRMFYKNLNKYEEYHPTPLKFEIDSSYQ